MIIEVKVVVEFTKGDSVESLNKLTENLMSDLYTDLCSAAETTVIEHGAVVVSARAY